MRRLDLRAGVRSAVVCFVLVTSAALVWAGPAGAVARQTVERVTRLGTVDLSSVASAAHTRPANFAVNNSPARVKLRTFEASGEAAAAAAPTESDGLRRPIVPGRPVAIDQIRRGFEGLTSADSTLANGFEVEPPDQGLCAGGSGGTDFVFESVNLALALYDTAGNQYTPPVDLNSFYELPPAFDPATGFGPMLSDPKCYFDPDTHRWFHSVLEFGTDPQTGDFSGTAATLLAVSTTDDPLGSYTLYSIDATDRDHPGCPCFGDQPLIGADANGFYVSTAEFSLEPLGESFNGAQIYAMDKRALATGRPVDAVHIATGTTLTGTVQPATAPNARYETRRGGTEYFMSSVDCLAPLCEEAAAEVDNRITVWALTNTASLRRPQPSVRLTTATIQSNVYGQPVAQVQAPGPRPLGESLGEPLPLVEANDARMNQVVFAAGRLWSGLNTVVDPGPRDGILWLSVAPSITTGTVRARIVRQGYVAAADAFVSFPSVGVNDAGRGVIAYSVMGPGLHPSAAWTAINPRGAYGGVRTARAGLRPEDGFSCYPEFYPPGTPLPVRCRWGDYSASFALPSGEVWSAAEFVGDDPRTPFANWSTFVWPVSR